MQDPCGPDRSPRMAPALSLGNMGPVSDFNHDLGPTVTVLKDCNKDSHPDSNKMIKDANLM